MSLRNFFRHRSGNGPSHFSDSFSYSPGRKSRESYQVSSIDRCSLVGSSLVDLISSEDWKLACMKCEIDPCEASQWFHRSGFYNGVQDSTVLPIHLACTLLPPEDFVECLSYAYPEGIRSRDTIFHRLPIHIACQTGASVEVIRTLLRRYDDGSRAKDVLGRLPIHYACSNGAPLEVIRCLLDSFLGSAACPDMNGWLPLHVVCRKGASCPGVVRALLEAFPLSVFARTKTGFTALVCAQKYGEGGKETVEILEEALRGSEVCGLVHETLMSKGGASLPEKHSCSKYALGA